MQNKNFTIRTMTREELDIAVDWAAKEGWNPGLHDADCFHAADPAGFLVGLLDGMPVATISVVKYGEHFGFLGFYIVYPDYRGKGYGIQTWNAGLEYLAGRTVGLDGVVAQQDNYRKSGFELAYRNVRYQGSGGGTIPASAEMILLSAIPFDEVCAYDQQFSPTGRKQFLRGWISQPDSSALGILKNEKLPVTGSSAPAAPVLKSGHCLPTARRWRTGCSLL